MYAKAIIALAAGAGALLAPRAPASRATILSVSKQTPHGGALVDLFASDAAAEAASCDTVIQRAAASSFLR